MENDRTKLITDLQKLVESIDPFDKADDYELIIELSKIYSTIEDKIKIIGESMLEKSVLETVNVHLGDKKISIYKTKSFVTNNDDFKKESISKRIDNDKIKLYLQEFGELPEGVSIKESIVMRPKIWGGQINENEN